MPRLIRVLVLALIGLALGAGAATPVSAGVIDYGATANCRYTVTDGGTYGWTAALLKKIAVFPPVMPKKTGTKTVGWRFIVERSLDRENTPWLVTYRSPLQRAKSSVDFLPMRVGVKVPPEGSTPNGQRFVWYRVILKMSWYGAGGSVQSKVTHLMNDMSLIIDNEELVDSYCPGRAEQFFDGA